MPGPKRAYCSSHSLPISSARFGLCKLCNTFYDTKHTSPPLTLPIATSPPPPTPPTPLPPRAHITPPRRPYRFAGIGRARPARGGRTRAPSLPISRQVTGRLPRVAGRGGAQSRHRRGRLASLLLQYLQRRRRRSPPSQSYPGGAIQVEVSGSVAAQGAWFHPRLLHEKPVSSLLLSSATCTATPRRPTPPLPLEAKAATTPERPRRVRRVAVEVARGAALGTKERIVPRCRRRKMPCRYSLRSEVRLRGFV